MLDTFFCYSHTLPEFLQPRSRANPFAWFYTSIKSHAPARILSRGFTLKKPDSSDLQTNKVN